MSAPQRDLRSYAKALQIWHIVATILDAGLTAFIFVMAFTSAAPRMVEIWEDFAGSGANPNVLSTYRMFITLLPIPIVAFLYHLLSAAMPSTLGNILQNHRNLWRWFFLPIIQGLGYWTLLVLSGTGGAQVFLLAWSLLVAMAQNGFLYLFERNLGKKYWAVAFRCLLGAFSAFLWFLITIMFYYFNTAPASKPTGDSIAIFIFLGVGLIQFFIPGYQLIWGSSSLGDAYYVEVAYLIIEFLQIAGLLLPIGIGAI